MFTRSMRGELRERMGSLAGRSRGALGEAAGAFGRRVPIRSRARRWLGVLIGAAALAGLLLAGAPAPRVLAVPIAGLLVSPADRPNDSPYVDRLFRTEVARPTSADRYALLKARQIEGAGFEVLPAPSPVSALTFSAQRQEQAEMRQALKATQPVPAAARLTADQRYQAMKDAQLR